MIRIRLHSFVFAFTATLTAVSGAAHAAAPAVNLVYIDNSTTNESYITSNGENQMIQAVKMAVDETRSKFPTCNLNQVTMIGRNDPLYIFKQREAIERSYSPDNTMIVGLKNSGETNLAAEAFKQTKYMALSAGVSSDDLDKRNPNFFSMANRIKNYATVVGEFINKKHYERGTLVMYPGDGYFAQSFTDQLESIFSNHLSRYQVDPIKVSLPLDAERRLKSGRVQAVVLPVADIQQAMPMITYLKQLGYEGDIIGSSNWGRAMADMTRFAHSIILGKTQIYFPNSWAEGESPRSIEFERTFKRLTGGEPPVGTAIYTFDAVLMAGNYLCQTQNRSAANFRQYLAHLKDHGVRTVRHYTGLENNNLSSTLRMVHFDGANLKLISAR